jgi:hypothetical protein
MRGRVRWTRRGSRLIKRVSILDGPSVPYRQPRPRRQGSPDNKFQAFEFHEMGDDEFPEVEGGGSLILAWQIRNKRVLVVGGGEVSSFQ